MSIRQRGLQFGGMITLLSLAGYALPALAQTGVSSSVGVPPIVPEKQLSFEHSMVGIQFGAGQNMQQGAFTCPCDAAFNGGKGLGWDASAFFELPIATDFFAGLKAGLDRKNTSTSYSANEVVIVSSPDSYQFDTVPIPVNITGNLTLSLLSFEPFIQYQVLSSNFFVQIGAGISDLTSSNFTQTRELTSNGITLSDGTTISPVAFTNGTHKEEFQYGALTDANTLLFSGIFSAGYNFNSGRMTIAPMVTYDYPFSSAQSGESWKIASLYGSLAFGFKLN